MFEKGFKNSSDSTTYKSCSFFMGKSKMKCISLKEDKETVSPIVQ